MNLDILAILVFVVSLLLVFAAVILMRMLVGKKKSRLPDERSKQSAGNS